MGHFLMIAFMHALSCVILCIRIYIYMFLLEPTLPSLYHYLWFDLTIVDRKTYIKYSDSFLPPVNILDNACQRQKKLEKFVMILLKRMLTIWLTPKLFFFSCMIAFSATVSCVLVVFIKININTNHSSTLVNKDH